jgi:serine/threonine protein kinase
VDSTIATLNTVVAAFQQWIEHEQQTLLAAVGLRERCVVEAPLLAGAPAALIEARAAVAAVRDQAYDAEDAVESAETQLAELKKQIKRAAERGRPPPDGLDAAQSKLVAAIRAQRSTTKHRDGALVQMTKLVSHFPELLLEFRELTHGVGHGMIMSGVFSSRTLQQFENRTTLATHPHVVQYAQFEGTPCVLKHYVVGAGSNAAGIRARKQFAKEVDFLLNKLSHPLVMPIISTFFVADATEPSFCVQLPWIGTMDANNTPVSSTLDWYLENKRPNIAAKIELIAKVLQALDHVHSRGVIHRDIKPQNIFVDPVAGDHLVLGDFDTSGLADAAATSTTARFTVEYAAPEVRSAGGQGSTVRSDVWSVGQVLHFSFCSAVAAMEPGGQSVRMVDASASFPPVVREAVNAMLQINPVRRPSAADASLLPCFGEVRQRLVADVSAAEAEQQRLAEEDRRIHDAAAAHQCEADELAHAVSEHEQLQIQAELRFAAQQRRIQVQQEEADAAERQQQAVLNQRQQEVDSGKQGLAADIAAAKTQIQADKAAAAASAASQRKQLDDEGKRLTKANDKKKAELLHKEKGITANKIKVAQEKAKLDADAAALKQREAAFGAVSPWYWHPYVGNGAQRIDVTADMKGRIEWLMNKTAQPSTHGTGRDDVGGKFTDFKVVKVIRIQNPTVWRKYSNTRSLIRAATPPAGKPPMVTEVNFRPHKDMRDRLESTSKGEHFFFHGTKDEIKDLVIDQGFDNRLGGGMLGQGTYLAESASKSNQYVPPTTKTGKPQWMFLARGLLGIPHNTPQPMQQAVRPPCTHGHTAPGCTHARCDSIVYAAGGARFREFVVYDNTLAYPEFLIQFERWTNGQKIS